MEFLDKLSYKKKSIYAMIIITLLYALSYNQLFVKVIKAAKQSSHFKESLEDQKYMQRELLTLKSQIAEFDSLDSSEQINRTHQENLKNFLLSISSEKASLIEFSSGPSINSGEAYNLIFSGDFKSLAEAINSMEQNLSLGKISGVQFYLEDNKRTDQKLRLNILMDRGKVDSE